MEFNEKIIAIQSELKAPKNQYNKFGKYKYRNCEDILEAIKPLLQKYGLVQYITDSIIQIGERYYIQATVKVLQGDGSNNIEVKALAREPENKKGMDESQITGTASSYARKYALNGMWLIDDTKDADTDEHTNQTKSEYRPVLKPDTDKWMKAIHSLAKGAVTLDFVKSKYSITGDNLKRLELEFQQLANEQ